MNMKSSPLDPVLPAPSLRRETLGSWVGGSMNLYIGAPFLLDRGPLPSSLLSTPTSTFLSF